ncbi:glycoside hydrolase family 127 protein [Lachnospiraceae bacterium OttesenSCG-928-D06]|nr:glycoside hydrolase family 127 protein [Lachnospiraceae bacterium OttesenSCG-928-D06]
MKKFTGTGVSFENVVLKDGFWKQKQDLVQKVTIDAVYNRFAETGRFEALKGKWKEGMEHKPHIFWESDVTKWIEGAAYFLQKQRDEDLERRIDELVEWMKKTQGEDGYLNIYFTVVEPEKRFRRRTDHELYCAGHLIEGGIAYAKATGKKDMLQVAIKYTDLIDRIFRIEHSAAFDTPGHEEIELALVKLYQYTGEKRYLLLAEYFINKRGNSSRDETYDFTDQEHMQSHLPVREQKTAEGHSVRALYLYAGMADLAKENQDEELAKVCEKLFENITEKRMYITGGIGSTNRGESFTFDYDLPEYTAYNETCASIALALFCKRMWLIEGDGKYGDCVERALYNTVLSGISLSGDKFFYENPTSADPRRNHFNETRPNGLKEHLPILERVKVFDCSCCPPNMIRTIGAIGDYMYSVSENTIYAQCYMDGDAKILLGNREISLSQRTEYPFDGKIVISLHTPGQYEMALRIPAWCDAFKISINKNGVNAQTKKGFIYLDGEWKEGDTIELDLEMKVKLYEANPQVIDYCGRVSVTRGPLVYCAEGIDNDNRPLRDIRIQDVTSFQVEKKEIDGMMMPVLHGKAFARKKTEELYREYKKEEEEISLHLIPYFAWTNRELTEMTTWFLSS